MYIVPIVLGYLLGSVIFSFVIGKLWKGIDVRDHGSGNAGATNTLRVLGVVPAILVLLLDIGKGVLAVRIGAWMYPDAYGVSVLCGLAVVVGHNWPVFFRFKGGKGIATTIGVVGALAFLPAAVACLIAVLAIAVTRYVSLGSLLLTLSFPILLLAMHGSKELALAGFAVFLLALWKHRNNVRRLLRGEESKLGTKSRGA